MKFSSVLWHCWLGDRKGILRVKETGCWFVGGDDLVARVGVLTDRRRRHTARLSMYREGTSTAPVQERQALKYHRMRYRYCLFYKLCYTGEIALPTYNTTVTCSLCPRWGNHTRCRDIISPASRLCHRCFWTSLLILLSELSSTLRRRWLCLATLIYT